MVVEGHDFQRTMALRPLNELGVEFVREAVDGAPALAILDVCGDRATVWRPLGVVIVDIDMPGMDGVELISHIAQRRLAWGAVVVRAMEPALPNAVEVTSES